MATRIIVNSRDLDGVADQVVAYTKKANDIGDLQLRIASFTNVFKAPLTPNNIDVLEQSNDYRSTTSFPYRLHDVKLLVDGIEILTNGVLVVRRVVGYFDLYIMSGVGDFFSRLNGRKLTDIDPSEFIGPWGTTSTVLSYTMNTTGVVAPVVNYIKDLSQATEPFTMEHSQNVPCIFYHSIMNRLIAEAGYIATGDVFSSAEYLKMIVPLLRDDAAYDTNFSDGFSASAIKTIPQVIASPGAGVKVTFDKTTRQDKYGYWDLANSQYVANYPGVAADVAILKVDVSFVVEMTVTGGTVNIFTAGGNPMPFFVNVGSGVYSMSSDEYFRNSFPDDSMYVINNPSSIVSRNGLIIVTYSGTPTVTINSAKISITGKEDPAVGTAGLFSSIQFFSKRLPDITQTDFIRDFLIRFGLIVVEDGNTITFRSLNDVIANQPLDWTGKRVDSLEELSFTPLDYAQENIFKFASEDDQVDEGTGVISIDHEVIEPTKVIYESPFASCSTRMFAIKDLSDNITGNILMAFVPAFQSTLEYNRPEPRLLMIRDKYSYEPDVNFGPSGSTSTYQVAFFEDPDQGISMSYNWFLNKYYSSLVPGLQRAKLVKRQYMLSTIDFCGIDFLKPVFDKDAYYLINEVTNFVSGRPTTVELFKL